MVRPAVISQSRRAFFSVAPTRHPVAQPDSNLISGRWNSQPTVVAFTSAYNFAYLKRQVLQRVHGAIGDVELLNYMRQDGVSYYEAICDWDYPATTAEEIGPLVNAMNERTLDAIARDYYASRQEIGLWRQLQHIGKGPGWVAPVQDFEFDHTIDSDVSQRWEQYNYGPRRQGAADGRFYNNTSDTVPQNELF